MKTFSLFALFLFLLMQNFAQFSDDFSDGDFTINPIWSGNVSDYQIVSNELNLNSSPVSSTKYLSTSSQAINGALWEFSFKMTVNPSSSNFGRVYLVSNTPNLSGNVNGYFVMIGGSTDEISLYKQSGSIITKIIDGRDNVVNLSIVNSKIKVTRTSTGNWQLFSDTTSGFSSYISEGSVTDNSHIQSLFFGIYCKFTSTRFDKFYFDDFVVSGTAAVDNVLPLLDSVNVISSTKLDLVFNEAVGSVSSQTVLNFIGNNGIGNPVSATRDVVDFNKVHLIFASSFPLDAYHNLNVINIKDIAGNQIINTIKKFIYYIPSNSVYRDVVINEFLADPTPSIGLPDAEYVEVFNNSSSKIFNLKDWEISGSKIGSYVLLPNEYVVVCANSDIVKFSSISNVVGVSSLSLSNSSDIIFLENDSNKLIDYMEYSDNQYTDTDKKSGGWSMELINPYAVCFNSENWIASENNSGGTLGLKNSVYDTTPDTKAPQILKVITNSNTQIEVFFNESIDTNSLSISSFSLSNGILINSININSYIGRRVLISLNSILDTGVVYSLSISNLSDCEGNSSNSQKDFVLPNIAKIGDLIINEILFDPIENGQDYVEIYNNSNKYIDLNQIEIGNEKDGAVGNLKKIEVNYIIKPNDYVVITSDFYSIVNNYRTRDLSKIIEINSLPTYSNTEGVIYIVLPNGEVSDKFSYNEEMHFSLLKETDGVSLERLDFNRETQNENNWHSAAETVGFGTPGVKNSQYNPAVLSENTLTISPEIFSPDNDGFEDILSISYTLDKPGYVGNLVIYSSQGILVKNIAKNNLLSLTGTFVWNGLNEENTKARIGRYIMFFEIFDLEGNVKSIKKTCVLGHKF